MATSSSRTKTKNGTGFVETVSATAIETTDAIQVALDRDAGVKIGFNVDIVGTSATYSVQHTFEADPTIATKWFDHETVNAQTADADGNYAYGITGIRLNVTAVTAATVTLSAVQSGGRSR